MSHSEFREWTPRLTRPEEPEKPVRVSVSSTISKKRGGDKHETTETVMPAASVHGMHAYPL
jgi:hypothetical protein